MFTLFLTPMSPRHNCTIVSHLREWNSILINLSPVEATNKNSLETRIGVKYNKLDIYFDMLPES